MIEPNIQAKWSLNLPKFLSSYLNIVVMSIPGRGQTGIREDIRQSLVGEVSCQVIPGNGSDIYHVFLQIGKVDLNDVMVAIR